MKLLSVFHSKKIWIFSFLFLFIVSSFVVSYPFEEEYFYENCNDVTDWTTGGWGTALGQCRYNPRTWGANYFYRDNPYDAKDDVDLNLSFYYTASLGFGQNMYFHVYASNDTLGLGGASNKWIPIGTVTCIGGIGSCAGTQKMSISDNIVLTDDMNIRFNCTRDGTPSSCTIDNINVTGYAYEKDCGVPSGGGQTWKIACGNCTYIDGSQFLGEAPLKLINDAGTSNGTVKVLGNISEITYLDIQKGCVLDVYDGGSLQ